jgi:VWFA-related protein
MIIRRHAIIIFACVAFVGATIAVSSHAQRDAAQQKPDTLIVNTGEVRLDAVVRDKRGLLIKDLKPSDFEVYEDGVRQDLSSVRFISPASANTTTIPQQSADAQRPRDNQQNGATAPPSKSTDSTAAGPGVSAIALVFDRLSPEARVRATQAALNYLQQRTNQDELFGVFLMDLPVAVLQPLTTDHDLVKAGVEKATLRSTSLYQSTNEEARSARGVITNALRVYEDPSAPSGDPSRGNTPAERMALPPPTTAPSLTQAGAIASMQLGLLERAEEDQRDELGNATVRGLLHIASSLQSVPGRKAVIFFSEGLILPPDVMQTFPAIINAANRNHVSFYPVDAAGLRVESKSLEQTKEIDSRAEFRLSQLATSSDSDGPMTKGLERNEDLLRLNPDSGLGRLASDTGGFLITNTNDLKGRLQRVDEDLHSYYLLSYKSTNQNYDGRYRTIEVKLKRAGLDVQSRKGYFGIKDVFASPVLSYEAPALAALENSPQSNSFPFYAAAFSFPERERIGLAPVLADLPLSAFTFQADPDKKLYRTDFCIVTVVKDQTGQALAKLSKQYQLSGPLDKLEAEKKGRLLFYREADLPPGSYTLETIAYDAPTGHASVRRAALEVTASDEGKLRVSDIVMLNRAEPASAADEKSANPFHVGNVIAIPNLGEPIHRSIKEAPFFFKIYLSADVRAVPKLTIELRQQDRTLAQMPGVLTEPDALRRIQYLAGLPLEKIPPGTYELRITVRDGTTSVTRSRQFTVAD